MLSSQPNGAEMEPEDVQNLEVEQIDTSICRFHWERKQVRIQAVKVVAGTPMCRRCLNGQPIYRDETRCG